MHAGMKRAQGLLWMIWCMCEFCVVLALQGSESELSFGRRLSTAPSLPKLTLMELIEDMKSKETDGALPFPVVTHSLLLCKMSCLHWKAPPFSKISNPEPEPRAFPC